MSVDEELCTGALASEELRGLYPEVEPYASGMLAVGDGNEIYWEESGNPEGKPVVFLHGGPGGGVSAMTRRFFDPERYRVVQFDQRNCGRSTPHASTPDVNWDANTTWHLVDDIERLRAERGIERWQVFGGSWGSALALAYAQTYPERVTELVLRGIFTLRRSELDFFYNDGASHLQPQWWERYCEPLGGVNFAGDKITRYHELLFDADPAVHGPAGVAWTTWEGATTHLHFDAEAVNDYSDPQFALAFARIENHYFFNAGWFREGQLIEDAARLASIPTVIVQGAYDLCCPARTAWALRAAMPHADFHLVHAGHSAFEPEITDRLVRATDAFAS